MHDLDCKQQPSDCKLQSDSLTYGSNMTMMTLFHQDSEFSEQHSRDGELRVFSLRGAVLVFAGGEKIFRTRACLHGGDDDDGDDGDESMMFFHLNQSPHSLHQLLPSLTDLLLLGDSFPSEKQSNMTMPKISQSATKMALPVE